MTSTEESSKFHNSQTRTHPSENEVAQLLQEATQQYEECMRIADLADISEGRKISHPKYAWDNPIGLVVTRRSNAQLV